VADEDETLIDGAVSGEYSPVLMDIGKAFKVRVSRAGYRGTRESDPTDPVIAAGHQFSPGLNADGIVYYSLSQRKQVAASRAGTAEWDFALKTDGTFPYAITNSGVTAESLNSGGLGGVWFTNRTDFENVSLDDRVTDFSGGNAEYEVYTADVTRYQGAMGAAVPGPMNIMTYYGYESGDGSEGSPFTISANAPYIEPFYKFNKKAFAAAGTTMPPTWWGTNHVYIIRHANGVSYSKLQVYEVTYVIGHSFKFGFRFENL
jgi:hypothetical protein